MKIDTAISHYNRLEGVERILTDLYRNRLSDPGIKDPDYDQYSHNLLKAITTVKGAQSKLPWSPDSGLNHT
jgi:hypothetical protein